MYQHFWISGQILVIKVKMFHLKLTVTILELFHSYFRLIQQLGYFQVQFLV